MKKIQDIVCCVATAIGQLAEARHWLDELYASPHEVLTREEITTIEEGITEANLLVAKIDILLTNFKGVVKEHQKVEVET